MQREFSHLFWSVLTVSLAAAALCLAVFGLYGQNSAALSELLKSALSGRALALLGMEYRVSGAENLLLACYPVLLLSGGVFFLFLAGHASGRELSAGTAGFLFMAASSRAAIAFAKWAAVFAGVCVYLVLSFGSALAGAAVFCGTLPDLLLFAQLLGGAFLCLLLMSCCGFFFGSAFQNAALRHLFCALTLVCLAACVILPACVPALSPVGYASLYRYYSADSIAYGGLPFFAGVAVVLLSAVFCNLSLICYTERNIKPKG